MFEEKLPASTLMLLSKGTMGGGDQSSLVIGADEINTNHDEELYFLTGYSMGVVEVFGCPSETALMPLAHYLNVFALTTPICKFFAKIHNPKSLPIRKEMNQVVVVMFAETRMKILRTINGATKYIEEMMDLYTEAEIDDVAVLIGRQLEFDNVAWNDLLLNGAYSHGIW